MSYYNAFVSSDWIRRGISPSVLVVVCAFFSFSGFFFFFLNRGVCRFDFADREITPFYAAFMMFRVGWLKHQDKLTCGGIDVGLRHDTGRVPDHCSSGKLNIRKYCNPF